MQRPSVVRTNRDVLKKDEKYTRSGKRTQEQNFEQESHALEENKRPEVGCVKSQTRELVTSVVWIGYDSVDIHQGKAPLSHRRRSKSPLEHWQESRYLMRSPPLLYLLALIMKYRTNKLNKTVLAIYGWSQRREGLYRISEPFQRPRKLRQMSS